MSKMKDKLIESYANDREIAYVEGGGVNEQYHDWLDDQLGKAEDTLKRVSGLMDTSTDEVVRKVVHGLIHAYYSERRESMK